MGHLHRVAGQVGRRPPLRGGALGRKGANHLERLTPNEPNGNPLPGLRARPLPQVGEVT